ncbi:putative microsomal signal peptidase [Dipodascopsis tothii]|uniref:putative microsomal signal peptidase n=1 Tax=Dipodascopsis tothii TaxID=44089 RepID=UPI0034CDA5C5
MFSTSQRLQNYCGFASTVALFMALAVALSSLVQDHFTPTPEASIALDSITVKYGRPQGGYNYKRQEYATAKFSVEADLTPLFNWNTKQVFVYLTASYPGKPYSNKVVLWDDIITSKDTAVISLKNQKADYQVYDVTGKFNERDATLALEWNVQPYVGMLLWDKSAARSKFQFPAQR